MTEPERPARRTLGAGATVAALSQAAVALGLGVAGIIVARVLGAGGTGAFNVVLTGVALLLLVSGLGIELGLNYHVSGRRWPAASALRQAQIGALVLGVCGCGLGVLAGWLLGDSAFRGVPLSDVVLGFSSLPFALSWTFAAFAALAADRYEAYGAAPAGQALLMVPLAAALTGPLGLTGAVLALTGSHAIVAGAMLLWCRRNLGAPEASWLRGTWTRLRTASRFGVPGQLANLLQFLNYRADLLVLNAFAAQAKVGQYAVALTVTTAGLLVPRALAQVVLPRVASLDSDAASEAELDMVLGKSVRHGVLIGVVTGLALAGGMFLVPPLYGAEFEPSVGLGLIMVPGVACAGMAGVLASVFVGKGFSNYALRSAAFVTPPTLVLYAVLIPTFEAVGAAVGSTASYVLILAVTAYYFRRATAGAALGGVLPGREEVRDYRRLWARLRRLRRPPGSSSR